ncbi:MAG: hypothetical protein KGI54_09665 [Pseudomonadota bacterium]|nr:hypothetical protein [Pseudomonadota bacterium]
MSQSGVYEENVNPSTQPVLAVVGDNAVVVPADPSTGDIYILGAGGIATSGNAGTYTLTINGSSVGSTIIGDIGSIAGPDVTIYADQAALNCGSTVSFVNSGTVSTLNVSDNHQNTIIGLDSGNLSIVGSYNLGSGYQSLTNLTVGNYNTAVGSFSLDGIQSGAYNVGIGGGVGTAYTNAESSNILINSPGFNGENNTLHIGSGTGTGAEQLQAAYISGIDGVNLNTTNVVVESANQLGTAVLTAGPGISITAGTNSITIASTEYSAYWNFISVDTLMSTNNGYMCTSGGVLNVTLPTTSNPGDEIEVILSGASGFNIVQGISQQIQYGEVQTTLGSGGSLSSTQQGDSIRLVCRDANAYWVAASTIGNLTIV